MIKLKTSLPQLLAFLVSFIAIVIYAIINSAPSIVVTFTTLYAFGRVLLNTEAPTDRRFFFLSFSLYAITGILLAISFDLEHGNPYIGGGDDEIFYLISRDFKNGLTLLEGREWSAINYKAYILIMAGWLKLLNLIGLKDDFFFNLNLVNSFLGALSVSLIYLTFKKLLPEETTKKIGWFILLFPPLIFYSATIIRDTAVLFIFSLSVYIIIALPWSRWLKAVALLVCIFFMYHLRDASAFFLIVFIVSYYALGIDGKHFKTAIIVLFFLSILITCVTLILASSMPPPQVAPPKSDILGYLSFRIDYYNNEILEEASQESLGVKLRDFSNPFFLLLGLIYMYFSPLPPLFFYKLNLGNIFLGLGNIVWYFLGFSYFFSALAKSPNVVYMRMWWAILMTTIFALLLVYFSSGDARHLLFIQPFLIGFAIAFLSRNKRSIFIILALLIGSGLLFTLLYLLLKFT